MPVESRVYIAQHGKPGDLALLGTSGCEVTAAEPRSGEHANKLAELRAANRDRALVDLVQAKGPWGRRLYYRLRWMDESVTLVLAEPLP